MPRMLTDDQKRTRLIFLGISCLAMKMILSTLLDIDVMAATFGVFVDEDQSILVTKTA